MRLRFVFVPPLALTAMVSSYSAPAGACIAPGCRPATLLPAEGKSIPASTPALPFVPAYSVAYAGRDGGNPFTNVQLLDGNGRVVASQVKQESGNDYSIVPDQPFSPGNYKVRFIEDGCQEDAGTRERSFTVTAAAPLPQSAGTLRVKSTSQGRVIWPGGADCVEFVPSAVVDLAWDRSETLLPYSEIVRPIVEVDGHVWTGPLDGEPSPYYSPGVQPLRLYAACTKPESAAYPGLTEGTHHVKLRAVLPGAPTEPAPAELDVTLQCDGSSNGTPAPSNGGSGDASSNGCSLTATTAGWDARWIGGAFMGLFLTLGALRRKR